MTKKTSRYYPLILASLFVAVLAVSAQIFVPLPFTPVSITLQTLALMLAAALLSPRYTFLTVSVYLLLGGVGAPVFSKFSSGVPSLVGPTGGFLVGFLPAAVLLSWWLRRGKSHMLHVILGLVLFHTLLYLTGCLWFMYSTGSTLYQSLLLCVVPFIGGDIGKCIMFFTVSKRIQR